MKAVILAAGEGKRLGAITQTTPKPMIKVDGKPILEHNILMCRNNGIKEILINVHHLSGVIENYFGNGKKLGVKINYSHESKLLGTSGTIRSLCSQLKEDPFFVIYGDNYFDFDFDFNNLVEFHKKNLSDFTIALCQKQDASLSGVAELNKNGKINEFKEKPSGNEILGTQKNWINSGLYFMESKLVKKIVEGYSDFGNDFIPFLIENNYHVYGYKMSNKVKAIDTPELLKETTKIKEELY